MSKKFKRTLVTCALPYANGPVHIGHLAGAYIPGDIYVRYLRLRGEDVVFVCGSDEHGVPITIKAKEQGVTPQDIVDKYHKIMKDAFSGLGINFDIYSRTSSKVHEEHSSAFFRKLYDEGKFITKTSSQYYDVEAKTFLADRYIEGTCPKCGNPHAYGDQCEKCGSTLSPEELIDPHSRLSGGTLEKRDTTHWYLPLDNIVFHCIVFPSMLKAYGDYILPDNVPSNEFLNLEGDKISTSRNWAVWVNEFEEQFPGQEDVLRYVLCANAPETKDNDFTWKDFQQRNNSELVAIFGNFVNRAVVLTQKYFGGVVPQNLKPEPIDAETLAEVIPCKEALEKYIETYHFREALKEAMNIARIGNKYISDAEPWKVAKTDMDRTASILYTCLQICADLAIAFEPFTPFSAEKLRKILRVAIDAGQDHRAGEGAPTENFFKAGEGKAVHTRPFGKMLVVPGIPLLTWNMLGASEILGPGHKLGEPELLFQKMEDSVVDAQISRLEAIKKANEAAAKAKEAEEAAKKVEPQKEEVTFDDFGRMDIRTATVLEAERVPKTDKLLKLRIDTGIDERTIVSGIAEFYSPEQMVGKQIVILANLAPRTIRGIESKGMILMARQGDGKMRIVTPEEALHNGATVG